MVIISKNESKLVSDMKFQAARRVCAKLYPQRSTLSTIGEPKNSTTSNKKENKRNPEQQTEIETNERKEVDRKSRTNLGKSEQLEKELNL